MNNQSVKNANVRYLVLESTERKPLLQELYEKSESPVWMHLFAETEWQPYLSESPLVVEVFTDSAACTWAMEGLESGRLRGLVLESQHNLKVVSDWLRERLTVRFDRGRIGLLRFYDPLIWHKLTPETRKEKSVIERAWYWHDAPDEQHWLVSEHPEPVTMLPLPSLEEKQWLALSAGSA